MAEVSLNCNVYQGFNFKASEQARVGFLTSLKIGSTDFTADIEVQDPTSNDGKIKAVAILSHAQWSTGKTDGVFLTGNVSAKNKQAIRQLTMDDLSNTSVEYKFDIYEYDQAEGAAKYYKSFHANDTAMKGLFERNGTNLAIQMSNDPSHQVQSPKNFNLYLGIKPDEKAQTLIYATSSTAKKAYPWGVTLG